MISDFLGSIVAAYQEWDKILLFPNYVRAHNQLTWSNWKVGVIKGSVTIGDVKQMREDRQFTFQVIDRSLIQLHYTFDNNFLINANLAFYSALSEPKPQPLDEDKSLSESSVIPLNAELDELSSDEDEIDYLAPAGWFRIDYDPSAKSRGVIHHDCHMHLSNLPNSRFIVDGVPTPRQFIEFVIAMCYPDEYKSKRLYQMPETGPNAEKIWHYHDPTKMSQLNELCFPIQSDNICNHITHLRIPNIRRSSSMNEPMAQTRTPKRSKVKHKRRKK